MKSLDADGSPKEKRRKGTGKITLTEVAEFVGVSAMTVSRALRMPEKVTPELRDRIDAAVSQLGYVPNLQARNLASVHSDLILAVVPTFSSPGFCRSLKRCKSADRTRIYHDVYGIRA